MTWLPRWRHDLPGANLRKDGVRLDLPRNPRLSVSHDTLTGVPDYTGIQVAVATMGYTRQHLWWPAFHRRPHAALWPSDP